MASRLGHEKSRSRTERRGAKRRPRKQMAEIAGLSGEMRSWGRGAPGLEQFSAGAGEEVKEVGICDPEGARRAAGTL